MTSSIANIVLSEDRPFSPLQRRAVLMCGLVGILDGNDSQAISMVARPVAMALHISPAAMGWAICASFVGAALGAMVMGTIADRIGPKRALVWAVAIFGVFTLLTPYVNSLQTLVMVRVLAGAGLGGATPCFIALASEYAPARRRATIVSMVWACFPLGILIGGFINGALLTHYSWEVVFYAGGVASIVVGFLLVPLLPESLGFLLTREAWWPRARAIVERIAPGEMRAYPGAPPEQERPSRTGLGLLLQDNRRSSTFCLWLLLFACFGTTASMPWLPTILLQHGVSLPVAAVTGSFLGFGALIGMFGAGWFVERFGIARAVVAPVAAGALATALMGLGIPSIVASAVFVSLVGGLVGAGASGGIALIARIYPIAMRSTGAGWAMALGRLGQVVMPGAFAVLLGRGLGVVTLFMLLGLVPLVGAIAAWRLARELAPGSGHATAPQAA